MIRAVVAFARSKATAAQDYRYASTFLLEANANAIVRTSGRVLTGSSLRGHVPGRGGPSPRNCAGRFGLTSS